MSETFTHLHTHSHYSLLEALPKIDALVEAAKEEGSTALCLADLGNMYGAIEFYKEAAKSGIKSIIGVDFFVAPRTRYDKEMRTDDAHTRLLLIAKNNEGYRNLIELVSKSFLEGFFERPRIDRELIESYRGGIIAILHATESDYSIAIRDTQEDRARDIAHWYKKIFGDDVYVEMTLHPEITGHNERMEVLQKHAQKDGLPVVASHEVYYLEKDDAVARELVNNIRLGTSLNRDASLDLPDHSFITTKEILKRFKNYPDALENNAKIAAECSVELKLGSWVFPAITVPEGKTHDQVLRELAYKGFKTRNLTETPELRERLDYELSVIAKKGYSPYFLVVSDLLRFAHENGILTNIRGSVAGSLVTYLSHITNVNPIEYGLPFERFLNPERPSAPDIDMDYADNRRDEMIAYARKKYGDDHVAQIGTFGTMMARAAVRDVCRALGFSYSIGDRIAKLIPFGKQGFPVTIESALKDTPELREVYKTDSDAREVLDLAQKIEANARHVGVHAAGVVIAPTPVTDFVPIQLDPKGGKIITQYDMYAVEDAGLLKFDFLGLTNLSTLADVKARVKKRLNIDINLDTMPLDDQKTFAMLSRGETLGVFQLAGDGMTNYLVNLKPSVIHDINAMVALYRPGPLAFIPQYIERKHNPTLVKYLDPRLESILKNSYGIITYQDDVLQIAIQFAGYSWLEADKFRKAMGKKIPEEMAAQKENFVKGCIEIGKMRPDIVDQLWQQIETFAAYGFNKAHAASYGNLAYKTAYMKANYPVDYMAALLTSDAGETEKIGEIVDECKRMKLTVLPPSVNESQGTFTVIDESTIRFGLYSIKNFGTGVADSIIATREKSGKFTSLADFLTRVTDKNLNKKSLESLIQCGALDELGERGAMLAHIEKLLTYHKESAHAPQNQSSLFGAALVKIAPLVLTAAPEATMPQKLDWEKELLGLYVSGHPLDAHREKFAKIKHDIKGTKEVLPEHVTTVIGGLIQSMNTILTKKGERMAFLSIADLRDEVEVVVFPRTYTEVAPHLAPGKCILVKGKMSTRNGEKSFVAEAVKPL